MHSLLYPDNKYCFYLFLRYSNYSKHYQKQSYNLKYLLNAYTDYKNYIKWNHYYNIGVSLNLSWRLSIIEVFCSLTSKYSNILASKEKNVLKITTFKYVIFLNIQCSRCNEWNASMKLNNSGVFQPYIPYWCLTICLKWNLRHKLVH